MAASTLQTEKNKLTISIIVALIIMGAAIFVAIAIVLGGDYEIEQIRSPITYLILGVLMLISLSHIVNKFFKYKRLVKVLPAMETAAKQLEMQYLSEESAPLSPNERNFLRPILGKLKGIKTGRDITIYPAYDFTRIKNNNPKAVTVFQMPLGHEAPEISIEPIGAFSKVVTKMLGGSIEFREKYYIMTQFVGNIDENSKTKILEDTKKIFPIEAMAVYESIPVKKSLLIKNNTAIFVMDGFQYKLESYQKGLEFITKVNGALVKTL